MIFNIISICLVLVYVFFLFWCLYNWLKIENKSLNKLGTENIKVAVIIPARNEAKNLSMLLQSLKLQDYPAENFQIIISDDHSTDNTIELAALFFKNNNMNNGICLISPRKSKKEAITYAIRNTDAELIITTDADTFMGKEWISSMVHEYVTARAYLICGPVKLIGGENYLEKLQSTEFTGLSGIGASTIFAGSPMFCNGANLAFSKKIFDEVNGYEKSLSFSGDDTQLMLKIQNMYPSKISFLKDSRAIVHTKVIAQKSELLQQRQRWASKIPMTLSLFTILISVLVWFVHVVLLIQLFLSILHFNFLFLFLLFMMIVSSEIVFIRIVGNFFNQKNHSWLIVLAQPVYCFYIVYIGLVAPFGTYHWKGRKLK